MPAAIQDMPGEVADAPINESVGRPGHGGRKCTAAASLAAAIPLLASLVTLSPAGAAEEPAGAGDSAPDT
ncbi:MAG: hypothetical protein OXB99_09455 [Acidimicrobiaceae bacterium]|nr:hypothetical protein [Acidimicrobiaceae bacterium]